MCLVESYRFALIAIYPILMSKGKTTMKELSCTVKMV